MKKLVLSLFALSAIILSANAQVYVHGDNLDLDQGTDEFCFETEELYLVPVYFKGGDCADLSEDWQAMAVDLKEFNSGVTNMPLTKTVGAFTYTLRQVEVRETVSGSPVSGGVLDRPGECGSNDEYSNSCPELEDFHFDIFFTNATRMDVSVSHD